ncbi:hypothetical protein [Enterobacter hormaechei]|uniref:hypothetical protein n=1 Tax=Enterobacter hormaechei TaxID=158836 RepID=UPI0016154DEC|nr:hypothetical protein [Enterobacter hormaechei]
MQTHLDKILDTCAAWTPQGDLADLIPGFIIGIFYAAVLYLFARKATTGRKTG